MARITGPVCKLCRREGMKLYLKGTRCDTPKCAIERRDTPAGHARHRRGKLSEYGIRLREKQKLKRFYGVLERQFRRYFELAARSQENTGESAAEPAGAPARQRRPPPRLRPQPGRAPGSWWPTGTSWSTAGECDIPSILREARAT